MTRNQVNPEMENDPLYAQGVPFKAQVYGGICV